MTAILTPKRRRLTKAAELHLDVLADRWHDGSTGTNAMIGLSIQRGMIYRRLKELALRDGRIPTGIIQVPPRSAEQGPPPYCAMAGFEVDLDELSVGLPAVLAERQASERRWRVG
jgi:hypothetical protein